MHEPIICFGQQPCGFFPKRYVYAKVLTARRLQKEIGGKIVFFYHDSDADYRETITLFRDPLNGEDVRLNFTQANKIQKKYSPLYAKMIPAGWQDEIARKLPRLVPARLVEMFKSASGASAGDFCLDMYQRLGLLDGIEIVRSGDKVFRTQADELTTDYYADIPYEGEIVRAEKSGDSFRLHEGGGNYITVPSPDHIEKTQKNPGRDYRFRWMQSVVHCTHYISGAGENAYLKKDDFPDVTFVTRDEIADSNYAYLPEA
ncbi:MAG: hypothetical protein WCG55_01485 [bacterium]